MKTFVRSILTHEVEVQEKYYTVTMYSDPNTYDEIIIRNNIGEIIPNDSDLGRKIMTEFNS